MGSRDTAAVGAASDVRSPAAGGAVTGAGGAPPAPTGPASPANAADGDGSRDEAFRALFDDHGAKVYRLLLRMGVASREVEDLCQEVFVVAHRNWHEFRGEAKRSTWLCGIAVRLAANHRRLARVRRERLRDPELGGLAEQSAGHGTPREAPQAEGLQTRQRAATLHEVLEGLDEPYRQVLVLYELEEMPMAEVAQTLGIPLQTGYSRLYAGRKSLSQALKRAAAQGAL